MADVQVREIMTTDVVTLGSEDRIHEAARRPSEGLGYALLVGEPGDELSSALGGAIPVVRCPGGRAVTCPAMRGELCRVRDGARVTIVFVSTDEERQRRLTCVGHSDHPVVAVIDGSDLPPRVFGRFGVVGAAAGPLGVLSAVSGVIEGDLVRSW